MDLREAIFSQDSNAINKVLKSYFTNPIINAKVQEWGRNYNLKNKEPNDILQEGILILFDKIQNKTFRGESSETTFLLSVCRNLIRDSVKKKEILDFQEHFQEGDKLVKIPTYDHFGELEKNETQEKRDKTLLEIIEEMDPKCEQAMKLFYYEKMKMAEIAIKRGLANAQQAKKALSRCRKKLRLVIENNPTLMDILNQ